MHGRWIDGPPWDDLDNLGHLDHFSVGQVGFIHEINFLDVIGSRILCTCSLENSVGVRGKCMSELNLGLLNALKYHWCETSIISNCLIRVVSKDFIFKKSVQGNGIHSQATTIDWAIYKSACLG